jgi:hypothetical protein
MRRPIDGIGVSENIVGGLDLGFLNCLIDIKVDKEKEGQTPSDVGSCQSLRTYHWTWKSLVVSVGQL